MKNAKFWLVQIAMVAIVSLIFGSPVFAGPPEGKGKGADTSKTALTNHAGDSQAWDHASGANENAAFMGEDETGEEEPAPDSECPEGQTMVSGIGCVDLL